jgi:prepilin-type N-terminal cleavage/methylation domain-containing protein
MIRPRRRAGFSLLEILLAVSLLAMITSAILGGLHLGKRAWETGRDYESVAEVEEAANAVAALMARAFPASISRNEQEQFVAIQGRGDELRFVATSEGGASWAGLDQMLIRLRGSDLEISTSVFRADHWRSGPGSRPAKALAGVRTFELSYFGSSDPETPPRWTKSWIDQRMPPRLVSARIVALRNGKAIDVSFTVALQQRPE